MFHGRAPSHPNIQTGLLLLLFCSDHCESRSSCLYAQGEMATLSVERLAKRVSLGYRLEQGKID